MKKTNKVLNPIKYSNLDVLDIIPFGEYKGQSVGKVIEEHNDYISWAILIGIISLNETTLERHKVRRFNIFLEN